MEKHKVLRKKHQWCPEKKEHEWQSGEGPLLDHVKDNLLFDSYAMVGKLEKQLDDMIRTSSSQDETLLQMEQELTLKKLELKQELGHYKTSNVDRCDAAHKMLTNRNSLTKKYTIQSESRTSPAVRGMRSYTTVLCQRKSEQAGKGPLVDHHVLVGDWSFVSRVLHFVTLVRVSIACCAKLG